MQVRCQHFLFLQGNDYQYLSPGSKGDVDIFSFGADGQPGGDGANADIGNWDLQ